MNSVRCYIACRPLSGGGGLETQNGRFPSKIALYLKKVYYKVSLREYCQRESCTEFTGLSNGSKWLVVDGLFYLKYRPKLTPPPLQKRRFPLIVAR